MFKECKMQDLSHLNGLMPQLAAQLIGGLDQNLSSKCRMYRKEYIRLLDKAIGDYSEARDEIISQIEEAERPVEEMAQTGRILYTVDFTNSMEDCLSAIRRLFHILEKMKREMKGDEFSSELRKSLLNNHQNKIASLRDTFEHVAERIQKGQLIDGEPIMLMINDSEDGVCIGQESLKFATIEKVLTEFHNFGAKSILDV